MTEKITKLDELKKLADGSGHSGKSRFFFYEALIDTELYLLLEKELESGVACPKLIETSEDKYALVFDTIARLVDFTKDSLRLYKTQNEGIRAMTPDQYKSIKGIKETLIKLNNG